MQAPGHVQTAANPGVPRWHARYRARASAVSMDIAGRAVLLYHPAEDISLGGARVATPEPEQTGSRVDVTLCTGDGAPPIQLAAKVAWARPGAPGRMGLTWIGLDAATRRELARRLVRLSAAVASAPGDASDRPRA